MTTAQNFTKGTGIILELMSGAMAGDTANKIPKFLSVSWLSCYPDEDEKLYYGSNVLFSIRDIIEAKTMKRHRKELFLLNKFQQTVMNRDGDVRWDKQDRKRVDDLVSVIKRHLKTRDDVDEKEPDSSPPAKLRLITDFGVKLFREFCEHRNTKEIYIKAFCADSSLPLKMRNVLFGDVEEQMSFIPITTLFKNAEEIELSELSLNDMASKAPMYVRAMLDFIWHSKDAPATSLKKISFKSKQQQKNKVSSPLTNIAKQRATSCEEQGWDLKYQFESDCCHHLVCVRQGGFGKKDERVARR